MKKTLSFILVIIISLLSVVGLSSCDDDGFEDYAEYGLKFRLPDYFRKRKEQYISIVFTTPDARFQIQAYTKEEIESDGYDFDQTVSEHAEFLIESNGLEDSEYLYDADRDVVTFYTFEIPENEDQEGIYHYFVILKSEKYLYCARMSCNVSDYENYEPLFRQWGSYIEIIEE